MGDYKRGWVADGVERLLITARSLGSNPDIPQF
jgi:hypothetical protein